MTRIRFWWSGYSPTDALESFAPPPNFEVSTDNRTWRLPHPGTDLATVTDWMTNNNKQIVQSHLTQRRRTGRRWEGLYILIMGAAQ